MVMKHCAISQYKICRKKAFLERLGQGSLLGSLSRQGHAHTPPLLSITRRWGQVGRESGLLEESFVSIDSCVYHKMS